MRPEFVDNLELKLIDALNGHLDWLEATYKSPVAMSIATGYFNAEGFHMIADRLERLSGVRLLLGAEPVPPPAQPSRKRKRRFSNMRSRSRKRRSSHPSTASSSTET